MSYNLHAHKDGATILNGRYLYTHICGRLLSLGVYEGTGIDMYIWEYMYMQYHVCET